jgi:lactate racemase-like protein
MVAFGQNIKELVLPRMVEIRQKISVQKILNIRKTVQKEFKTKQLDKANFDGLTVGIAVGSRGISDIAEIISCVVEEVKDLGGNPVIIPAMGSHGGGTVEGRRQVLANLGISEENAKAQIRDSEKVKKLGQTDKSIPVYCNIEATKVDSLIIVNRIKSHTDFVGKIESGLQKLMAIGLGSHKGCSIIHAYALKNGLEEIITSVVEIMLKKLPIVMGLAILENQKNQTFEIKALKAEEIQIIEPDLLKRQKASALKLPFDTIDVLVVGEIGKNISGTGMDCKTIGRLRLMGQHEPEIPKINRIAVLRLSSESHGNALGIGLSDFTTRRVYESIDSETTKINCMASICPESGMIPIFFDSDRETILAAIRTCGEIESKKIRLVYIKNTQQIENIWVSEKMLNEAKARPDIEVISNAKEMQFDSKGDIICYS